MHISTPQQIESIPYNGAPKTAFFTIALKSKRNSALTNDDFFKVRSELLPFLASHPVKISFPFGFTNKRLNKLMVCFEGSPKLKPLVDELCFNTMRLTDVYRMTLQFAEF